MMIHYLGEVRPKKYDGAARSLSSPPRICGFFETESRRKDVCCLQMRESDSNNTPEE